MSSNYQSIEQVLDSFLFNQNTQQRQQAEEFLNQIPQKDFLGGVNQYLSALLLQKSELSELAAILLKKQYIDNEENLSKISPEAQQEILSVVQQSITSQPRNFLYIKRGVEIIIKIYTLQQRQDDLIKFSQTLLQTQDINLKKGLLYLIEIMCEYSFEDQHLLQYFQQISHIFTQYLEDPSTEVRACAFKSLVCFLCSVQDETVLKQFEQVFPVLINKCVECVQSEQEAGLVSLGSLIDLIEIHPKFIKPLSNDFLILFNEIISNKSQVQLRIKALSGVMVLCANNSAQIRKNTDFQTKTIPLIFQMLTEADTLSLEEWAEELDDQVLSKDDPSSAAEDIISKIGADLGNKYLFPLFAPFIKQALSSQEWNIQHAGLVCIAQLTEGCKEMLKNELVNIVEMIKNIQCNSNNNIRGQYDILTTYSLLCGEFCPIIQHQYGETILQSILQSIKSQNLKLQFRSIQSIINFCKEIIEQEDEKCDILFKYADQLLQGISHTFQQHLKPEGNQKILEETLIALSTIAISLQSSFQMYYDSFMPGLTQLLSTIPAQSQCQLAIRVLTIECMGYLLTSIKENKGVFTRDCQIVMEELIKMQSSPQIEKDDPHHSPIFVVYGQVAQAIQEDFVPYLQQVVHYVIQGTSISIDAKETEQNKNDSKISKINLDLGIYGGIKTLQLNASALEQKIEAFHTLNSLICATKKGFFPFIDAAIEEIENHFTYKYSKEIKETVIKTIKGLLEACSDEPNKAIEICNKFFPLFLSELQNALKQEDSDMIVLLIINYGQCLKALQNCSGLNEVVVEKIIDLSSESLKQCKKYKKEVVQEYANEDMDNATQEEFEIKYDDANELMECMVDFIGQNLKHFKMFETKIVNTILPDFYECLTKDTSSDNEINIAICVFDELFYHSSQNVVDRVFEELIVKLIDYTSDYEYNDIKQSSAFGIGILAMRCSKIQFSPYLDKVVKVLISQFEKEQYKAIENKIVHENITASLIKVCLHQIEDVAIRNEILVNCFQQLPFEKDEEEAKYIHTIVSKLVAENSEFVQNENVKNSALIAVKKIQNLSQKL